MKDTFEKSPESKENNDNVFSLEKKLKEKTERLPNFEKEFKKQFFQNVERDASIVPIERGLERKAEIEIDPKIEMAGKQLAEFSSAVDELEQELNRAKAKGKNTQPIEDQLQGIRKKKEEKNREFQKILNQKKELVKRADEFERRRIYGEQKN